MITAIEPKSSRIAGGINIEILGEDLFSPLVSEELTLGISQDTSVDGTLTQDEGITFFVPATTNARAQVTMNRIFPEVFSLGFKIKRTHRSFPSTHKSRTLEVEVVDPNDITKIVRVGFEYLDRSGHNLFIETYQGPLLLAKDSQNINPNLIDKLTIKKSDKFISGIVKLTNGGEIFIGKSLEMLSSSSKVRVGLITPKTGYAREFDLKISKIEYETSVFFSGEMTEMLDGKNDRLLVRTSPGSVGLGKLAIFKSDFDILSSEDGAVKYTLKGANLRLIRSYDTVQSVYQEITDPLRKDLFNKNDSMKWDTNFLLSEKQRNQNLFVPSLWDPTTGGIPQGFFQSGVGTEDALKFLGIKKYVSKGIESWYAHIKHGTYYVYNVPYFLFSDQSVVQYLDDTKTSDGRSMISLEFTPKMGVPLVASSLMEDVSTKLVLDKRRITKKGRFSGIVRNGVELDPALDSSLIDTSVDEFIVRYNPNNRLEKWTVTPSRIETLRDDGDSSLFLYEIDLPQIPLTNFKLDFSRRDIFFTEKTYANRYGEGSYGEFFYGEGLSDLGDYAIDFIEGKAQVLTDREYTDFGVLSYDFDYPAVVEFNQDFVTDYGLGITEPNYKDLAVLDNIGASRYTAGQAFRLSDFPIIDTSTKNTLDRSNFKLFVYDDYQNSFDSEWIRVSSLLTEGPVSKSYVLDSENGVVTFGDGVHGMIPPKYLQVLAGYKSTLKLQYEPQRSNDYWIGKSLDLNLDKSSLSTGFMYLSRKELVPNQLIIEFNTQEIYSYETAELTANVYSQEGDKIPGIEIKFETINGNGEIMDDLIISDANGEGKTFFTPSTVIEDMGVRIDCYAPGESQDTLGAPSTSAYQSSAGVPYVILKTEAEIVDGELDRMYLFKILDDGDSFLPYDKVARTGGRLVVVTTGEEGEKEVLKPEYLAGQALGFSEQLPQPFNPVDPNYTPDLRGFYVVGKKTISIRGYVDVGDMRIYSDIINLKVQYSDVQLGQWKLFTEDPVSYAASQIDTATYLNLNRNSQTGWTNE